MRFWHRLLAFLGLSPPSAEAAPHPCSGAAEARETPAAELANALTPLSAAGDERNRKENDCGEDLTRFLLYANRHAKARLRRCDSRGRWWLFETDNEGNLTATVYRLEPTAPRGLAEFLASRRMSISYPINGCERAWLDDPQAVAEKFHGALADALLALRATAQGTAKANSLLAQLIYPGGDVRFSRWIERLVEIYKQSLLGVAAISSREGQQPPQRHLAVVLNHDLRTTASAAIAEMVAAVAAEARDAGIAAPAFVLSPALLWEECRCR
ncbi:MAG: hypothetical protein N3A66_08680, partial [Planctomycetota bacterium]|nr:hypothetical protein [Planctomycetota bacterium]